uniref:Uncharacterized protein n=1 Tax=Saccharum officinarum TaxID=4547 RepID=A0A678TH10_SACOF|nr:hypothetical protein SO47K18_000006 [Saccharum officinarum]
MRMSTPYPQDLRRAVRPICRTLARRAPSPSSPPGGGRGQGHLILASKWEPALSDNTRAPPARAALHGCPWLGGDQPEARDGTISVSRGGRRCPYLISSTLPDVIVERGCGAISVEGKRGGEPISRPSWPEVPSERDRSGWAGATN